MTLRQIYEAQFDWVLATLGRLGVPDADRDDLCHDLFVVVHRRLADFDRTRALRPWLFGIAYRVVADHRRRARHRFEVSATAVEPADPVSDPEARVAARRRVATVIAALGELGYERRAVFVMHALDGFSGPEIAAAAELPLNTVYSHLRRGRIEFAAALARLRASTEPQRGDRERA